MSRFGIDFAWGRPSVHELQAAGVSFVGRYLSHDESKNLSNSELRGYQAHGIGVVIAWEDTADAAKQGELLGRENAATALREARAVGLPENVPINFAVDFDAEGPEVFHYFRGARGVVGERCGVYAGYRVVRYLFDNNLVSHAWQTYAWSGGQWDRRAAVRQYSNGHTLAGVDCDYNVAVGPITAGHVPNPLDVLTEAERDLANSLLAYRKHPREHGHGLKVTHERLVVARKQVWVAAEKGKLPNGRGTRRGWQHFNRAARYRLLWSLTR